MATEAVDLGRVRVNGERIKPAREARIGDRVEVSIGDTGIEIVVRELSTHRGSAATAQHLYEETADSRGRRERVREARRYGAEPARSIKGRPTKREGRALRLARQRPEDD